MNFSLGLSPVTAIYQGARAVWPYEDTGDAQFVYVGPQSEDRAAFEIGSDLIVGESEWAVELYIPRDQIISIGAESVTMEA
jgi:hypothetical protein